MSVTLELPHSHSSMALPSHFLISSFKLPPYLLYLQHHIPLPSIFLQRFLPNLPDLRYAHWSRTLSAAPPRSGAPRASSRPCRGRGDARTPRGRGTPVGRCPPRRRRRRGAGWWGEPARPGSHPYPPRLSAGDGWKCGGQRQLTGVRLSAPVIIAIIFRHYVTYRPVVAGRDNRRISLTDLAITDNHY